MYKKKGEEWKNFAFLGRKQINVGYFDEICEIKNFTFSMYKDRQKRYNSGS